MLDFRFYLQSLAIRSNLWDLFMDSVDEVRVASSQEAILRTQIIIYLLCRKCLLLIQQNENYTSLNIHTHPRLGSGLGTD